jgi:hypothetical protein
MRPRRPRGLTVMEAILAITILVMAFMVFMTVFSSSSRLTIQSRDRTAAIMLCNSLMDELEAHPWGAPAPKSWSLPVQQPVGVWVEGRHTQMVFHAKVEFENGSAVGLVDGDQDVATITISWREGTGTKQPGVVVPDDNKVLTARYPVWR